MQILVIDGMGGGLGKLIIEKIKAELPLVEITAVGTNTVATTVMLKAGADHGATGENAVVHNSGRVDFIIGGVGIAFANSMHGEVSPKMAKAVSKSPAHKILIPIEKCNVTVMGVQTAPVHVYVEEVVGKLLGIR
ncbi:MAG: DUF3842 family protein [Defluviitaleaceae bacterium]|nr:DUF3842 family protein [Defluviitaleaceae bacterium]